MEQGQCWMWTKRKYSMSSYLTSSTNASYDDSWEEQAFAEDAAGSLGGCIWPPRSYTCSFCRREFRSAQALGGHMNVHRRDRARLKQTSSPQNEVQNPFTSLGFLYPSSPVCGLAYNTKPNSDPSVLASPSSRPPSKALLASSSIIENCREETLIPTHNSSESWSKLAEERLYSQKFNPEAEKISKILGCGCLNKGGNYVQFETKEEAAISCKKRRTDIASSIQFFPKSNSFDRHHRGKVFEFSSSCIEELDLELRLGQRPEV